LAVTLSLVAVASFNVPGNRPDLVAAYLFAEHGIGVRGGKFSAHPDPRPAAEDALDGPAFQPTRQKQEDSIATSA
jgi:selenocysteine lyase/cysteine desulfurase